MKKRSMLAIASLATGFVVAAVTPSHAIGEGGLGGLDVKNALGTLDQTVDSKGLGLDQRTQGAKAGKSKSKSKIQSKSRSKHRN